MQPFRFGFRSFALMILIFVFSQAGGGLVSARDLDSAYDAKVDELKRDEYTTAVEKGREEAISRYRALIDGNPGKPRNIEMEMRIVHLIGQSFTKITEIEEGEERWWVADQRARKPAALAAALDVIKRYDAKSPGMAELKIMAAGLQSPDDSERDPQKRQSDLAKSETLLRDALDNYSLADDKRLRVYLQLAHVLDRQGDYDAAEKYCRLVLDYGYPTWAPTQENLRYWQSLAHEYMNARAFIFQILARKHSDPHARLAALLQARRELGGFNAHDCTAAIMICSLQKELGLRTGDCEGAHPCE